MRLFVSMTGPPRETIFILGKSAADVWLQLGYLQFVYQSYQFRHQEVKLVGIEGRGTTILMRASWRNKTQVYIMHHQHVRLQRQTWTFLPCGYQHPCHYSLTSNFNVDTPGSISILANPSSVLMLRLHLWLADLDMKQGETISQTLQHRFDSLYFWDVSNIGMDSFGT